MTVKNNERSTLKWRQLIGDEDCAKAGLDPDSCVPNDQDHAEWKQLDKSREPA